MSKYTYWCRWEEPEGIPQDHMIEYWPVGMKAWVSGHGPDTKIWCARVDASTPEDAEKIIRGCYGKSGKKLAMSFIEEQSLGWRPTGGRFPE